MKRLIIAAGLAAFAGACDQSAPPPEPTPTATEEAPVTTANGSPAGGFNVTAADGTKSFTVLSKDGTFVNSDAEGNVLAEGSWEVRDGKTCFTPNAAGGEPMCYTEDAPGEDGSFVSTPDSGDPVTVRPVPSIG